MNTDVRPKTASINSINKSKRIDQKSRPISGKGDIYETPKIKIQFTACNTIPAGIKLEGSSYQNLARAD